MTRLVNEQRNTLRRAILADVPKVDYEEKIRARALKLAVFELPAAAKRIWEDPATRGLLKTNSCYFGYDNHRRQYAASVSLPGFVESHKAILEDEEIIGLVAASNTQADLRAKLDAELRNNLVSVNTHDAFAERWPELVKYLPDGSEAKVANLPATTQLLDDLKAAGLELDTAA